MDLYFMFVLKQNASGVRDIFEHITGDSFRPTPGQSIGKDQNSKGHLRHPDKDENGSKELPLDRSPTHGHQTVRVRGLLNYRRQSNTRG